METPICITDAQTFTDHIHEIKDWIYNGHLRLVVPSSTSDNVEQLYLKSVEQKPGPKETSKPKPFGKPAKKEYPAFDINPRIAREFLSRLQAGKDGDPGPLGRPIYGDQENHDAVKFQQPSEQYTPWKNVEDAEEKVESPKEPPTTWAEALRRKQNLANGVSEKMKPKGPVKPKLVAKTPGGDNSPWKIQRNAPTVSANEVPNTLRPMMSCALWRIHESIDRNDANQLFVLCDQQHIRDVAKKLNIITRSTKELAADIANGMPRIDRNEFGDLERNFGVLLKPRVKRANGQSSEGTTSSVEIVSDAQRKADDDVSQQAQTQKVNEVENEDAQAHSPARNITNGCAPSGVPNDSSPPVEDGHARPSVPNSGEKSLGVYVERASSPIGSFVTARSNGSALYSSPPVNGSKESRSISSVELQTAELCLERTFHSPAEVFSDPKVLPTADSKESAPGLVRQQIAVEPPVTEGLQDDAEDSEEETIVFQPKRMSAQRKPPSRPSTASGQPQPSPVDQVNRPMTPSSAAPPSTLSPDVRTISAQVNRPVTPSSAAPPSTLSPDVRPISAQGQSPKVKRASPRSTKAVAHGHPRHQAGPTVIDPDAFGRDFAVNTAPNARGSVRSMRVRHSPHSSIQHFQLNPPRPGSSHRSPRVSPPRPQQNRSPGQAPKMLEQAAGPTLNTQINGHYPEGSQANLQTAPKTIEPTRPTPTAPMNGQRRPRTPAQDSDFVRDLITRPAPLAGPQLRPNAPQPNFGPIGSGAPRSNNATQYTNGAVPSRPRVNLPRTSKPSLFEPMIDHTRAPRPEDIEPRSRVPEVQYILKSGSTREAARGKGKLWVG